MTARSPLVSIGTRGCGFPPGTRLTPGEYDDELFVLLNPNDEKQDDWNYWFVISCPDIGPWWICRIEKHWGRFPQGPYGTEARIGEPLPNMPYQPPPPPANPPYQPASSSWD